MPGQNLRDPIPTGYFGIVKDASDQVARVELHTNCKTIAVNLDCLRELCVLVILCAPLPRVHPLLLCFFFVAYWLIPTV